MKIKRWIGGAVLLSLLWMFRSFLPFMFFFSDGVEVVLNIPTSLKEPIVTGSYKSLSCEEYWYGTDSWHLQTTHSRFKTEKISETQYKVTVPLRDYSPCGWRLTGINWSKTLKDPSLMHPKVVPHPGGGVGPGVEIVYEPTRHLELYQNGAFVIDEELIPTLWFSDPHKANKYVDSKGKYMLSLRGRYKNLEYGIKGVEHPTIIYNATVDDTKIIEDFSPGDRLW